MADIDRINELVGEKEFDKAQEMIASALKEEPDNVELIKLAGLVEVNLNQWEEARKNFETVVKYRPEDATSLFYLGNCYDNAGDYISAKNAYLSVIKLRPEYIEAYKSLCVALMKLDDSENAIKYAYQASALDPEDYIFDFIIGTAYMKIKEFEKSIEPLKKAYNIGSVYQIQQNHQEACEYLKKAVQLDDEDEGFKVALAMSEVKSGQYREAADIYKSLLIAHPEKDNYKYNLVSCYEALGDIQTAISMLEKMVYVNQKFILPAQKLASLYIKTNQLSKAKEIYDNILLKNKPSAETLHQYAVLSSSLCDTDTAEKILKKVIKMNPDIAKAHKDLGIIFLNKRLFKYAEEEFQTALKLAPNDFEIIFEYGNFLYSISKNTEAERYYQEALDLQPDNVLALTFMALNKLILNQLDASKEYIMKAVKINPHHEYIQFCAGRILFARKEYDEAKHFLIHAVEQNPDIETQNTLALTYYELGEFDSAINIFNNLLVKKPDNISVLMSLAKCYEGKKDNDKALEYLDKVVTIFPEDEEAHEMIRKLS